MRSTISAAANCWTDGASLETGPHARGEVFVGTRHCGAFAVVATSPLNDYQRLFAGLKPPASIGATYRHGHGVEAKFVDGLRSVAATMELLDLQEKRSDFVKHVQAAVEADVQSNGLELESVSLTKLDQTDISFFNAENFFDERDIANKTASTRAEVASATQTAWQTGRRPLTLCVIGLARDDSGGSRFGILDTVSPRRERPIPPGLGAALEEPPPPPGTSRVGRS